ncbi:SUMO1 sentrin specific peptidase 1 [Phlyctochytrium bullatum]|nr:SUMO1 sentrin specific peptidase 1 [Phlyctochytrium bullatum]
MKPYQRRRAKMISLPNMQGIASDDHKVPTQEPFPSTDSTITECFVEPETSGFDVASERKLEDLHPSKFNLAYDLNLHTWLKKEDYMETIETFSALESTKTELELGRIAGNPITLNLLRSILNRKALLNDEAINSFLQCLQKAFPTVKVASSFYYSSKMTRRKELTENHKMILIPVNTGNHWILACTHLSQKTIVIFDSLSSLKISDYKPRLQAVLRDIYGIEDAQSWGADLSQEKRMQQDNTSCGAFICMYAFLLARHGLYCEHPNLNEKVVEATEDKARSFRDVIAWTIMLEIKIKDHMINK